MKDQTTDLPEPSVAADNKRYHALDALRGIMMMLGIVLHTAMNYVEGGVIPQYVYKDPNLSMSLGIMSLLIHLFRMPTFFVMVGFFTAMLVIKRGKKNMLNNRLKRIVLPFLVFWPILFFLIAIGQVVTMDFLETGSFHLSSAANFGDYYRNQLSLMHLWFLYYLIIFYALFVPVSRLVTSFEKLRAGLDRFFAFCLKSAVGPYILAIPIAILGYFYPIGKVTHDLSFIPNLSELIYSCIFIIVGWYLYKNRELLHHYRTKWRRFAWLGFGAFFLCFVGFALKQNQIGGAYTQAYIAATGNLASWFFTFALIGGFQHFFQAESYRMRYISDASYWVYLIHFILAATFPVFLYKLPWIAEIKFLISAILTTVVCFGTYHFFVRSTFIGQFLNGRKYFD